MAKRERTNNHLQNTTQKNKYQAKTPLRIEFVNQIQANLFKKNSNSVHV